MPCLVSPEDRVPKDHPLRGIKKLADAALGTANREYNLARMTKLLPGLAT